MAKAITAAQLMSEEHAEAVSMAMPRRRRARLVQLGADRGVRIAQSDGGKATGFWEAVAVDSTNVMVWWMPGQDVRTGVATGTLLGMSQAPLHFPQEWGARVAEAIQRLSGKRDQRWTMPI